MFETVINLKPRAQWRPGMTIDKLVAEMDKALQFPGVSNAWTMPIKARIDMLPPASARRSASRSSARDLAEIEQARPPDRGGGANVPGTTSAYAERIIGGYYLDIEPDRAQLARYGLIIADVQDVIATALGGETVTTTVEGRERYRVNVRYPRDLRSNPQAIATDVLGPAAQRRHGAARRGGEGRNSRAGRPSIRTENGQLAVYIYVDMRDRDLGGYVADAQKAVADAGQIPARLLRHLERPVRIHGARHGAAENRRAGHAARSSSCLLYLNFRRLTETLIVMLSLPFALVGGIWLMWWLGFNMSVAVAVGFIALAGVAAETGVVMLIYLDHALTEIAGANARAKAQHSPAPISSPRSCGAVERVRPKMMTVAAIMAGLLPILWSTRHRLRGHAAHRRADDRRHGVVDGADARRHPGDLCAGQRVPLADGKLAAGSDRRDEPTTLQPEALPAE